MILTGILSVLTLKTLLMILGGTIVGIIVGSVPGLTVTMGVALFLPITFGMSPVEGLSLLMALYIGGTSGGLISAILLKIPGTPASIATTFDGAPMAARGEAGRALGIGIVFSFIGGMLSLVVLFTLSPFLADVALQFGPFEYFSIALFSLTLVAGLSGNSLLRGTIAAVLGVSVALVGMAPITGFPRLTFGISELDAGISLLPALIGLFAISQVLDYAEGDTDGAVSAEDLKRHPIRGFGLSLQETLGQTRNALRSSAIGVAIGILPGLGAAVCNIIAYGAARKASKTPEKFGTGIIDGIVASESSNNASTGGAMVPLMTLGIPGDNTTAILLAGFMIHGITPGPLLFDNDAVLVYGIFTALVVANVAMLGALFFGLPFFVKVLAVPRNILLPVIVSLCVIGAYAINNRMLDVWTMLAFGLVGYAMKKARLPTTPLLLGFILAPIIETNLRRGLQKSQDSFLPFLTEPISGTILVMTLIVVIYTLWAQLGLRRHKRAQAAAEARRREA
ncbi:tripartite tricarboxylate transporter permease [Thioclava sp. GXIMD2076]|uniref:tripartite tricarboxylate transporter permease n=1 Tax=Thioclava sp. GXIMD2076 TaxID=3131931 RepID=UPI0030CAE7D9